MELLKGKVALITGASRGIGKAIAYKFATEGADLAITARNSEALINTAKEIEELGVKVKVYASDASNFEVAHDVIKQIIDNFGKIDILVNNAGITRDTLLLRMSEQQWDDVLTINLKSAFNFTHAVTPFFVRQRSGNIINISSVVGERGNAGQCNYAASKAGLIALARSVAKELGSRGVRANCIAPGFIDTDMTESMPEALREQWLNDIPLHRAGKPEEVANVALFLASELSSYITGQTINCDGCIKG